MDRYFPPINCPWECHLIGGPWISENPSCPFHGRDPVDCETLSQEEGDRMCREETARREQEEAERRRREESDSEDGG